MRIFINPFREPRAWVQRSVGSVAAFSGTIIGTIGYGVGTMILISKMGHSYPGDFVVAAYVAIAVGIIGFPLLYLMMLRLLLLQYNRETEEDKSP